MKKILVVFGTRPEAIKMCPLVKELKEDNFFQTFLCVTGQHREMLDQVLNVFNIFPDFDLSIMQPKQTLFDVTISILEKIQVILKNLTPDIVLVHGDTTTAFITALACFYLQIPIGHVEAGLRTNNVLSPFPEEFNRQGIGLIASYHFTPTLNSRDNLLREGKLAGNIFVTGNTAIDALKTTILKDYKNEHLNWSSSGRMILVTAHRRENLGLPLKNMFRAIKRIINETPDVKAIYPIHMNPLIRETASEIFGDVDRIRIIEPLNVIDFHNFLNQSYLVITDSGGIQEEAPSLGKPVLVMRNTTERPEGVAAGTLKLVGTNEETIYSELKTLLNDKKVYIGMANANNPYGDGTASKKIVRHLKDLLNV